MKQLLILSGKGGTGKTTISSAFIKLAKAKAFADCDVDAPNLHLIMKGSTEPEKSDYYGLPKAKIHTSICTECDLCRQNCAFDAIYYDGEYKVDNFACEGCSLCEVLCPVDAISMEPAVAGHLMLYKDDLVFSTARLKMGSGNSGLLVSKVKSQMKSAAEDVELSIIDGSPGIGCPVIASISGVDMVLIVAEPSISGISDMDRIVNTVKKFQVPLAICINKYTTNIDNTRKIEDYCKNEALPMIGKIPFDKEAIKAVNNGKSIVDIPCKSGLVVKDIFKQTMDLLFNQ
jgi:MinD superfamily P-loop ATPase